MAVGLAVGRLAAPRGRPAARAMALHACLAMLPDLDAAGALLGRPFAPPFGHRGATHSLLFAMVAALAVALASRERARAFGFAFLALASHGPLDMCTHGGRGVALLWPLVEERVRFPFAPLAAAPMGLRLVSARGLRLLLGEALLFSPLLAFALWPRRAAARRATA
jgi:inner membrane protein